VVDFVNRWAGKTGIAVACFLLWLGLATSKWHAWKNRYGKANEHNAWIPRDHWLEDHEKQAIIAFHERYPPEGYRRLTFMMLDRDVVACSPSSVYRVLKAAGLRDRHTPRSSAKGEGFVRRAGPLPARVARADRHAELEWFRFRSAAPSRPKRDG
jgi:hypothetical protein